MATIFNTYLRLEPRSFERNLEAGFSAAIHDPLWFLARQWQMGEHQGENASSPVWVSYRLRSSPIRAADPRFDPRVVPAEAIVESEADDWWTLGRRVRIGQRLAAHPAVQGNGALRFVQAPPPYEHFSGHLDGLRIWQNRVALGIGEAAFGAEIPPDSKPAWDSRHLLYQQTAENAFTTDHHRLQLNRHRGGRLDWYSVDAGLGEAKADTLRQEREAIPSALQYPGAPNSRWWQLEDAEVDMGGYAPDSAHTPTAMLTELIFSHSDDWFLFPVLAKAGHVVALETLQVHDAFGRQYRSQDADAAGDPLWPGLQPPPQWSLFQVEGLAPEELVLWHVAELPLESNPVERVQFGLDEASNLLWAVERILEGREVESRPAAVPGGTLPPPFNPGKPSGDARPNQQKQYAYVPGQGIIPHWHPYEIAVEPEVAAGQRWLVQRRLVDLSRQKPVAMPAPAAAVLQDGTAGGPHRVAPLAIPSNGIEVERRWQLARAMDGKPVLWMQRQRRPLLSPPARRLRFDVLEEANQAPG